MIIVIGLVALAVILVLGIWLALANGVRAKAKNAAAKDYAERGSASHPPAERAPGLN